MKKWLSLLLCLFALASINCHKAGGENAQYKIAVIPKGTTHEFWQSIHAGANKAKQELAAQGTNVELIWKGPIREDDREQQVQVVEGFRSQHVSGIVLAPLDNRALVRPVEEAAQDNIPTVIIDSGLETKNITSFVATDNFKGGQLAAEQMGTLLNGKGNVILLRYQEGSASTTAREDGFLQGIKKFPGITLISSDQYAGATRETALTASQNVLNRFGGTVQGIFTVNESATAGMLNALRQANKSGTITFIGFDSSPLFIEAMRKKELNGIVVQDPLKMGYLGVKTLVEHLQGKPVEARIDTGVTMVTPENLDAPQLQALLHPPLDQYLK